jgi:hypothetical protein
MNEIRLLGVVLIIITIIASILKLTGRLDLSWWWIFSPILFIIGCIILVGILVLLVIITEVKK